MRVQVAATPSEAVVRVIDHGPGVPPEERELIFEPFHRGARSGGAAGAGLGLAIARGFAEANGGRVAVESRAGQGATFVLSLPGRAGRGAGLSANGPRVLVVDDEQQILRALRTSLRGAGYEVDTADTAESRARGRGDAPARRGDPRPRAPGRHRHRRLPRAAHAGARRR